MYTNIDALPLGKLLKVKYVGKRPAKRNNKGLIRRLLSRGFSSSPKSKRDE